MKKTGPYVGVTGFNKLTQIVTCNSIFHMVTREAGYHVSKNLKFMAGVLVSSKTLAGEINKYPFRYPDVICIPEIFCMENEEHLLRTIHYNTDDPATIDEQIDQVMNLAPGAIDALQLNMRWVSPVKMQRVKRKYPDLRIILQVGAGAISDIEETGEIFLGDALKAYDGVADDFLIDPSGGKGKALDVWHAFACLADSDIPANMQPNIAGGFNADNVIRARGLMRRLKRPVGIDAEGQLRTTEDLLNMPETIRYIKAGVELVGDAIIQYRNKPS